MKIITEKEYKLAFEGGIFHTEHWIGVGEVAFEMVEDERNCLFIIAQISDPHGNAVIAGSIEYSETYLNDPKTKDITIAKWLNDILVDMQSYAQATKNFAANIDSESTSSTNSAPPISRGEQILQMLGCEIPSARSSPIFDDEEAKQIEGNHITPPPIPKKPNF